MSPILTELDLWSIRYSWNSKVCSWIPCRLLCNGEGDTKHKLLATMAISNCTLLSLISLLIALLLFSSEFRLMITKISWSHMASDLVVAPNTYTERHPGDERPGYQRIRGISDPHTEECLPHG